MRWLLYYNFSYYRYLLMRIKSLLNKVCCFAVLSIAIFVIPSCKSISTATTSVQVINASPDAGPVDFYLSGNLKTSTPVAYGNSSAYFLTIAGNQTGEVKSPAFSAALASVPVGLASNVNYSVFVSGQTSTNNITAFYVRDNLITPAPGKAKLRFVHAVAAARKVNLLLNANVIFTAIAYKSISDYIEVPTGSYSIRANLSDSTAVGVTPAFTQTFDNGKIYTIIFKGAIGATADALKLRLGVMANN